MMKSLVKPSSVALVETEKVAMLRPINPEGFKCLSIAYLAPGGSSVLSMGEDSNNLAYLNHKNKSHVFPLDLVSEEPYNINYDAERVIEPLIPGFLSHPSNILLFSAGVGSELTESLLLSSESYTICAMESIMTFITTDSSREFLISVSMSEIESE